MRMARVAQVEQPAAEQRGGHGIDTGRTKQPDRRDVMVGDGVAQGLIVVLTVLDLALEIGNDPMP